MLLAEHGLSPDVADRLEQCLETGDRLLKMGLSQRVQMSWLEMKDTFHTTLVGATRNRMPVNFVEQSNRIPLASSRLGHWYRFDEENFDLAKRAHQAHHEFYDALSQGQAVRAEALMREHIYFSQRLISEHVRERIVGLDTRAVRPRSDQRDVTPTAPAPAFK